MTYEDTLTFLYRQLPVYQNIGKEAFKKDLTNINILCKTLGNPQNTYKSIHIAGTNGKGSVSHMLTSIFMEAGLKVGTYTSPHYKDFRERIRINGQLIDKDFVVDFVQTIKPSLEEIEPSFFEITVAMAFKAFEANNVDIAIIETGLGGKLDSTNIITPILSIITNIDFDHMQMLGDTLPVIAKEKAGIIKPSIPVIIGQHSDDEVDQVFIGKANECNSNIYWVREELDASIQSLDLEKMIVKIAKIGTIDFPIPARYQLENIRVACAAALKLKGQFNIDNNHIISGLEKVNKNCIIKGRFQVLHQNPTIILDSAHNEMGIRALFQQIKELRNNNPLLVIFGCVNDKDVSTILPYLPKDATYIATKANVLRAMDADKLGKIMIESGLRNVMIEECPQKAKKMAIQTTSEDGIILICGSIFLIAELL